MPQFPSATFLTSAWQPAQFPPDEGVEVAFAGRSNAGKSSALNAITGRRDLARTSKTPGRTQLINFFGLDVERDAGQGSGQNTSVNAERRLTDLPGYGYAKVPEQMRQHWRELMTRYVEARASLGGLIIVMDARRPLTDFDVQMLDWTQAHGLPTHLLLTKADKLSRSEGARTLQQVQAQVAGAATAQLFSAVAKTGVEEARQRVLRLLAAHATGGKKEPR
jgi:GTP-binding protein